MLRSSVEKKSYILPLGLACTFSMILLIGLLRTMYAVHPSNVAVTQGATVRYVAPAPAGNDSSNNCTNSTTPCATIQHAVDVADAGDEIRVAAGTYSDVHSRPRADTETIGVVTQVVYISQTLAIRGGYSTSDWTTAYPLAQPTTLDAQGQGRVLYITGAISPTIEGLNLTGGNADGLVGDPSTEDAGGGIYVISATATISNSQIFDNIAVAGGGLYALNSQNLTLASSTIISNTGLNRAGGIYFRSSPGATLTANTIHDNTADHVGMGQKHHGGAYFFMSDSALLVDNIVSDNSAADECGGITFSASENATLIGNTVTGNSSGSPGFGSNANGGGMCFTDSSGANLNRTLIIHNNTYGNGGGLYLARSHVTMSNNVIADNQILTSDDFTGTGSGLHVAGSSPQLIHITFARNSGGDGSGLYASDSAGSFSHVTMTNTIVVDHVVGVTVTAGNTATLNSVLWHNNSVNSGGMGATTVTNAYTGAPAFASDGYHLTITSAAIDRGINTSADDDIDGQPRPCQRTPDLGADELSCLYLPVVFKDHDPQVVELTGILHAGDVCVFCCYPTFLETTDQRYEIIAFGLRQYDGLRVRVRGLRHGFCEWSSRPLISVTSIEVLDPIPP